jgi:ATP-binding cassette subfamily B protein
LKKELRLQYNAYLSKKESLSIFHDSIDHAIGIKTQASVIRDFSMQLLPSLKKRAAWLKKDLSYQSHYVNMADTLFLLIMGVSQLGLIAHYYHQGFLHSPGEFTFVALISLQVHHELSKLMKKIVLSIQEKIIKIKKAYHFIKRSPSDLDPPNAQALSAAHGEIVYTKVSFTYEPGKEVLKNIDVRILPGQKVALMGTSDSGKRTFIKSLLKYFPLGTGAITIDGQDLAMVTQESLSDPIALITQSTPLFAASVLDNLRIVAPKAPLEAIEQACKKAAIHEDIMAMDSGYNTVLGQQGVHLSEGQSQRLAVARALLKNATIVIFEELTPSDDAPKDPLSASAINAIITESNATRLILAHKKATLLQMDRIFVFDQGSLVQDGTHDQLMKESDGTYKKLLDDWYNYC